MSRLTPALMNASATSIDSIASPGHDPALLPFLRASDPADAERLLAELFACRVTRTTRNVVRHVLHSRAPACRTWAAEDVEDLASEAVARVLRSLRGLQTEPDREPIHDLEAYSARIATHTCYEHFRRRHPERVRLRNQIRCVLSRDRTLTLDRDANGAWICGIASGSRHAVPRAAPHERPSLPHLIRIALTAHSGRLTLNDLVDVVARTLGIGDAPTIEPPAEAERVSECDAQPPLSTLENAQYMTQLWAEVGRLPLRQRTALLLNLRDASGGDALDFFALIGTASLRDIAGALELDPLELARLWPDLPLDDRRIAERLGVTRQQVINLRKAARARLSRRMAAAEPAVGRWNR